MRHKAIASILAVAALSVSAAPGFAYQPENTHTPAVAIENCGANVEKQSAAGITAGGGPKAGVLAPTNCDKFFGAPGSP